MAAPATSPGRPAASASHKSQKSDGGHNPAPSDTRPAAVVFAAGQPRRHTSALDDPDHDPFEDMHDDIIADVSPDEPPSISTAGSSNDRPPQGISNSSLPSTRAIAASRREARKRKAEESLRDFTERLKRMRALVDQQWREHILAQIRGESVQRQHQECQGPLPSEGAN